MPASNRVKMVNPNVKGGNKREPAEVSRKAFEKVWKDKGWEEVSDSDTKAKSSSK